MSRLLQDPFVTDTIHQNQNWNWTQFWTSSGVHTIISSFFRVRAFGDHVHSVSFQRNQSIIQIGSSASNGWYRIIQERTHRIRCDFSVGFQSHEYSLAVSECTDPGDDTGLESMNVTSTEGVWKAHFVDPIWMQYQVPIWVHGTQFPAEPQYVVNVHLRRKGLQASIERFQSRFPDLTVAIIRQDGLILWANREPSEFYGFSSTFFLHESSNPVINSFVPLIRMNNTEEVAHHIVIGGRTYTVSVSKLEPLLGYKLIIAYTQDVYLARFYVARTFAVFLVCGVILVHGIISYKLAEMVVGPFSYMMIGMMEASNLRFRQKRLSTTSILLELAALQTNFSFMIKTLSQHLVGSTRKRRGGPSERVRFHIEKDKTAIEIPTQETT
jgi:hypothetical protein